MENPFADGAVVDTRWRVTESLGKGVFGESFLVTDATSDVSNEAAMKVWTRATNSDQRKIFSDRMNALKSAEHPNLSTYLGHGRVQNGSEYHQYFVSELGDVSLAEYMKTQATSTLPTLEVYRLLEDLADGLTFLHDQDIVHGNINPSTVLNCDGVWKLAEFGLPLDVTDTTSSTSLAPELTAQNEPTPSSDVFALGAVGLFCSSATTTPGSDSNVPIIHSAELTPQIDPAIDPSLRDLLRQSTRPNPDNRITLEQLHQKLKADNR